MPPRLPVNAKSVKKLHIKTKFLLLIDEHFSPSKLTLSASKCVFIADTINKLHCQNTQDNV
jgi:hypothetical protein